MERRLRNLRVTEEVTGVEPLKKGPGKVAWRSSGRVDWEERLAAPGQVRPEVRAGSEECG